MFIIADGGGPAGFGGGWSWLALAVASLGAAGGLLVALSIKYGDSILKTLATTSAIVLSSILDHFFLSGPLTPIMALAGIQVILSIFDYTFDQSATQESVSDQVKLLKAADTSAFQLASQRLKSESTDDEQIALIEQGRREA
jgi:UDP-sugar transporter A1/2/3